MHSMKTFFYYFQRKPMKNTRTEIDCINDKVTLLGQKSITTCHYIIAKRRQTGFGEDLE